MDTNLQTNNEKPKIGAGIITLAVLHFIGIFIISIGIIAAFVLKDTIEQYSGASVTTSSLILLSVIELILLVALILLLRQKKLGVYLYYTISVLSFANSLFFGSGINIQSIVIPLVLPTLMLFFLKDKFKYFT